MSGPYDDIIAAAAAKYDVDGELIAAVIQHESGGNSNAVGDNGLAHGLMQMHPTACETIGADYSRMFDPAAAIDAGTHYLRWCYDLLGEWSWALAAYNQGPTVMHHGKAYADAVISQVAT